MSRWVLKDEQWKRVPPLLPGRAGGPGRSGSDNWLFLEAVLWMARTGAPWRTFSFCRVSGMTVSAKIGQLLMPEACANLTFAGMQRNRLFICGSQSVYTIYTGAQGAHRF